MAELSVFRAVSLDVSKEFKLSRENPAEFKRLHTDIAEPVKEEPIKPEIKK